MSLIHDALKKAQEQQKAPPGEGLGQFQEYAGEEKPKFNKRTIVLVAVLFVALAIFAYMKFSSNGSPKPLLPGQAGEVPAQVPGAQDVGGLKKSAIDAYRSDNLETAWTSISTASQLEPKDPEIWNNMGLIARKRGDVAKAREAYQKALELKPDYPEALNNLAVLDMQAGNNTQAEQYLQKALKLSAAYPEANFHYAMLLEQKGDKKQAVDYYKRFLDVSKDMPSSIVDQVRDHVMEIEP